MISLLLIIIIIIIKEKKDKYLVLARELKKLWNMKVTLVPIVIGAFGIVTTGLWPGRLGSWQLSGDHPNNSIIENSRKLRRVLET